MKFSEFAKVLAVLASLTILVVIIALVTKANNPPSTPPPVELNLRVVQLNSAGGVIGEWRASSIDLATGGGLRIYTNGPGSYGDWNFLITAPYRVTREK